MWVSKGGQYKTRGNVITFSQDISHLCSTLPRLPEQLDILVIRKPGARDPSTYKDFRVRKHKVLRLLRYLKEHNQYYKNITIRPPDEVDLPLDGDILHRLPVVESPAAPAGPSLPPSRAVSTVDCVPDELEPEFTPDELAQEQNLFAPGLVPGPSELEAICDHMRDAGLAASDQLPLPWPAFGPPLSEYTTEGLFSMAFPALFPTGKAEFTLPRRRHLALHEWVKHLMRYRDTRFASHPRFRFFALNMIFRHRAMRQGRFLFLRSVGNRNMTIGQLKEALVEDDGPLLASKIVRCVKAVRGTRPYWYMEGAKLKDMITQIGTPTLFYTLSMADLSWPDLHRLMPEDPFRQGLTDAESFQIRMRNIANNPHIVSAYLSVKHKCLRETILQHLDLTEDSKIADFWFRVEWQARGSGELTLMCRCPLHPAFLTLFLYQVTSTGSSGSPVPSRLMISIGPTLLIVPGPVTTSAALLQLQALTRCVPDLRKIACLKTTSPLPLVSSGILRTTTAISATAARSMVLSLQAADDVSLRSATNAVPAASISPIRLLQNLSPMLKIQSRRHASVLARRATTPGSISTQRPS